MRISNRLGSPAFHSNSTKIACVRYLSIRCSSLGVLYSSALLRMCAACSELYSHLCGKWMRNQIATAAGRKIVRLRWSDGAQDSYHRALHHLYRRIIARTTNRTTASAADSHAASHSICAVSGEFVVQYYVQVHAHYIMSVLSAA